jgi:DUF4097 and DUF4098 domain-containing protein YvlB
MTARRLVWVSLAIVLAHGGLARAAPPKTTTQVAVKGRAVVRLEVVNVQVTVKNGPKDKVVASADRCDPTGLRLETTGDKVDVEIDEFTGCQGPLSLEIPAGGDVELQSVDGAITVTGAFGEVDLGSVNGKIRVDGASRVRIESVNAPVECRKATHVEVSTLSGGAIIETAGTTPRLDFETFSGSLDWSGVCAADCRLDLQSMSGLLRLRFDPKSSDFELRFQAKSGKLLDELKLAILKQTKNVMGGTFVKARYKSGAGAVDVDSFSGNLEIKPKK